MRGRKWIALSMVFAFQAMAAPAQTSLPFRIEEPAGVARKQWPVRVGIPLAKGAVKDVRTLGLMTPDGRSVGLQRRALCRWPDRSVKWALLDFRADLGPGVTERWGLRLDARPLPEVGPDLAKVTALGVEVSTGPLRILFPTANSHRRAGGLFRVWLNGNPVEGAHKADAFLRLQSTPPGPPDAENWLRDAPDDPGVLFWGGLDPERKAAIEENGPLHAIVRLDGWHAAESGRKAFPFTLRVHVYRNSSRLRFQHTFVASELVKKNFVREMGLILPFGGANVIGTVGLSASVRKARLGPGDALSVSAIGDPRLYHFVSFRDRKRVRASAQRRSAKVWSTLDRGEDPPGWAVLTHDRGSMAAAFRDFRNLHPKELRIEGDGRLVVYLWPERGAKCLDLRRRSEKIDRTYNENGRDPWDGRGIAKTHEWMVEYSPSVIANATASDMAKALNEPVFPYITPEYYLQTGAFGEFLPHDPKSFPRLEAALAFGFRYMRAVRRAFGMDGMIDWGDIGIGGVGQKDHRGDRHPKDEGIPWRGYMGWCNSDFSLAHGFFLHYVRTGDRRVLLDGEAMAMHVVDIDTNHYCPEQPETVGMGHRHDQQHWGNGVRGYCYAPNAAIDLYLLTGNRRALDVAREMADHFVRANAGYGRYMVLRFWEISGEKKYLDAARKMLKLDLVTGTKTKSGWPFAIGANFRSKSYDGVGYTFYDSILPDPGLTRAFLQAMEFLRPRYVCPWRTKGHPDHCVFALAHRYAPTPKNTEALKIAVWLAARGLPRDSRAFDVPENAPFEKMLAVNRKTIKVGRTDVFGLYYLVGLPRALARLKAAGVGENEAVDYEWQWADAPTFVEVIDNKKVFPQGKSWHYYTKNHSPSYRPDVRMPDHIQAKWRAAVKRHYLYENGRKLGPHPYSAAMQIKHGKKGWTRRLSAAIRFTTPDNADPRKNARVYRLVYINEADAAKGIKPEDLLAK